ncbi:MAG: S9 family peptidase [Wenzhouxiangellaceae bacterium]
MDVFGLEWVSDPQLSPDGKQVVYVRNGLDIMTDNPASRLWLINADGSGNAPLTGRDVNESGAAWSPDGSRIAFVSEGPAGAEIYVSWVNSGKTHRLSQLNRSPSGLSWSPDGKRIAFTMLVPEKPPVLVTAPEKPDDAEWAEAPRVTTRLKYERDGAGYMEPGFQQYFVIDALGGAPRQLTQGGFRHDGQAQWAADGQSLIFSGNRSEDWERDYTNTEIYQLALDSGEITALSQRKGPDFDPVISPDGRHVAWSSYEDQVQTYQVTRIRYRQLDNGAVKTLPLELDRSVYNLAWDRDGDGLFYQYDDHGDTKIGYVSLNGRQRAVAGNLGGTMIGRPYGSGSFSVAGRDRIAYTHVTPYRPAELAIIDRADDQARVITAFNDDWLNQREMGKVESLWYRSTVDDREIQGWLVYPPGYDAEQQYPLLVENHGGPIANYGARFSAEMQLYAAAGYLVFYPNPRGSTSYGEEFGNLLYHNYPGDDYQDVMDGVDHLIKQGLAHENQLYVTGGSAGGIMTAWIIGKNSRFEAAVVAKPVMNWISKTLTADNYFMYANYRYPGQPWENIETYMKYSPVSLVGKIQTPTMVMVGTEDLRTPLSEAKQLYGALKIRGIDAALVEIPGASHSIARRPSQLITKVDHVLAWFAKYHPAPAQTE